MSPKKRLEEILVEAGVMNKERLEEALRLQKESGKLLGQILAEMGWATEQEVCRAVATVLNMDYMGVDSVLISQDVVRLIPEAFAAKHSILPLFIQDQTLYLAMENALESEVVHHIEANTGMQIKSLIAPSIQLRAAIRRHYDADEYVGRMLGDVREAEPVSVEPETEASEGIAEPGEDRKMRQDTQIVRFVNLIIAHGVQARASDIRIESTAEYVTLRFRIDGMLTRGLAIPQLLQLPLISTLKGISGIARAERPIPQNGCFRVKYDQRKLNLRVSTRFTDGGEGLNIRILDPKTACCHLNRLGFSQEQQSICRQMLHQPQGWIVVTGPPECGKTTTLYALLNTLKGGARKMITLENPVESHLEGIDQFQINATVEQAFSRGLRALLQQNPDVIFVGEIRDAETAGIALQAAETGHFVLSPLHASDAVASIHRLLHLGIAPALVASNLLVAIAQRLVRRICPQCKTQYVPTAQELRKIGIQNGAAETLGCYQGAGCQTCRYTGYYGQTGIYEFFVPNDRLREEIRRCPTKHTLRKLALEAGMETLLANGIKKIRQGITTLAEVARVCAVEPEELGRTIACPRCGKTVMKTENICPFCRSRLYVPCEHCGAELEQEWLQCPFCGAQNVSATAVRMLQGPQSPRQPDWHPRQMRIVVAEHDESTRNLVTTLLEQQGSEVFPAVTGEEALEKIRTEFPDLILLDVNLPKRGGFSVCKALRSGIETMFMPVIMLTDQNTLEEKVQGLSSGANAYLTKPVKPDALLGRIELMLRQAYQFSQIE